MSGWLLNALLFCFLFEWHAVNTAHIGSPSTPTTNQGHPVETPAKVSQLSDSSQSTNLVQESTEKNPTKAPRQLSVHDVPEPVMSTQLSTTDFPSTTTGADPRWLHMVMDLWLNGKSSADGGKSPPSWWPVLLEQTRDSVDIDWLRKRVTRMLRAEAMSKSGAEASKTTEPTFTWKPFATRNKQTSRDVLRKFYKSLLVWIQESAAVEKL
ncbi:hypothetical protein EB796_002125 [Bugula neritina]|uniref:Uncharacterized protein n=1 Tax=Bugula neritina TaxID=10212 RepID=A0A7J7KN25_BUGNE|nr:hypothetical protein EB796_002125 [Bugula neritina]